MDMNNGFDHLNVQKIEVAGFIREVFGYITRF